MLSAASVFIFLDGDAGGWASGEVTLIFRIVQLLFRLLMINRDILAIGHDVKILHMYLLLYLLWIVYI